MLAGTSANAKVRHNNTSNQVMDVDTREHSGPTEAVNTGNKLQKEKTTPKTRP